MKSGVYKITNIKNSKIYIGVYRNLDKRKREHYYRLSANRHINRLLQNDFNKYGKECFEFEVLEFAPVKQLYILEKRYIKKYNSYGNGYNMTTGGDGSYGHAVSDETKRYLSEINTGENNPNWGRKISEEHKQKLIEATKSRSSYWKGKKLPELMKRKIAKSHIGIRPSEETRLKMSKSRKGQKSYWKGKSFSKEYKRKLSEAHKGIRVSDETKKKLSILNSGEKTNFHKLKEGEVIEIKLRSLKGYRQVDLAREFNVTKSCISSICKSKTWKYIPNTIEELEKMVD